MNSNYLPIITDNLTAAVSHGPGHLASWLCAQPDDDGLIFRAFGAECRITAAEVTLQGQPETGPLGVILSLYARHANEAAMVSEPWKAFGELPDSRPYVDAFASHTEIPLVPHVAPIMTCQAEVCKALDGEPLTRGMAGDLALAVTPLPKIQLAYVFYQADDEFPASVKCLFSSNAHRFLPVDGLADVGEYTSKAMIGLLS